MKFMGFAILAIAAIQVQSQDKGGKDLISGRYKFIHQNLFEDYLKAYGFTDETDIKNLSDQKPDLLIERNGDKVTVTNIFSPSKNSTTSFTFGEPYDADYFGNGKSVKTISSLEGEDTIKCHEVDKPENHRIAKFTDQTHTLTLFSGKVVGVRTFERITEAKN